MNEKIDECVASTDKLGDEMIETIIIPLLKTAKHVALDDNIFTKSILIFKSKYMQEKVSLFLKYINEKDEKETIYFIHNMDKTEKAFFIETINKVIDMNDELQIYVLAYLTKKYKENNRLNYYETQIFYNINTLSNIDFENFYKVCNTQGINSKSSISFNKIKDITEKISINKFTSLGLLIVKNNSIQRDNMQMENLQYRQTDYTKEFYDLLVEYFKSK